MTILTGYDVSIFQSPALIDWGRADFGIVRATYGKQPDKSTIAHAQKIRAAGKTLGFYHFWRPDQKVDDQFATLAAQMLACNAGPGDMLPAIDVEAWPDVWAGGIAKHWAQPAPSWCENLQLFSERLTTEYGGCIWYVTQRDFGQLGHPVWMLTQPLWVANYPGKGGTMLKAPATPAGRPWTIWQCLVAPQGQQTQDAGNPKSVDQNIAHQPLPVIGGMVIQPPIASPPVMTMQLTDQDWDDMRAERDAHLQHEEDVA